VTALAVVVAGGQANLAAVYVAIGVGAIVYLLHTIEFKVNRLLDERGIHVIDTEIAKD
jgi:hypothetical protein